RREILKPRAIPSKETVLRSKPRRSPRCQRLLLLSCCLLTNAGEFSPAFVVVLALCGNICCVIPRHLFSLWLYLTTFAGKM
ncbi:hypothetical protein HMPREF1575_01237, partial [Gardnerella vaginalis JCP7672]